MKLLRSSLVLLAVTAALAVKAQSADEIVNKHITAIGGKDVISKLKSMTLTSEISVAGQSLPSVTSIVFNKAFKNVTSVSGMEIIQCFTTDTAWLVNPLMGASTPQGLNADQRKLGAGGYEVDPLLNYKERGSTLELAGNDSINGVKAIKLRLKEKAGSETTFLVDPSTYYILKQEIRAVIDGQEVVNTSAYSDFKKTDSGLVLAYVTNTTSQGYELVITHTKVEFNKEIDPKIFEIPKS